MSSPPERTKKAQTKRKPEKATDPVADLETELTQARMEHALQTERVALLTAEVQALRDANAELQALSGRQADRDPHPPNPQPCGVNRGLIEYGSTQAFHLVFGVAPASVLGRFRKGLVRAAVEQHFPTLRRSSLRAILEGDYGVKPFQVPVGCRRRVAMVLNLADLCETIVQDACDSPIGEEGDRDVPSPGGDSDDLGDGRGRSVDDQRQHGGDGGDLSGGAGDDGLGDLVAEGAGGHEQVCASADPGTAGSGVESEPGATPGTDAGDPGHSEDV